ncbi:hypothetical protein PHJA_001874000 [Phtheirospermum japonicum]|uniref:Uncharacterized protein n=1 Tax=Phtheirospermum japonicum TaxID=374723 RepID=A0A830CE45_9LAMI|nr:hypothetical protein PHJA_001874000 [Phtheirospermum japonicum]
MPPPRLQRCSATPLPHRPLPTPRSSNPGLPFLSFNVNSAAASTSFTAPPVPLHHWRRWRLRRLRGRAFAPQGTRH